MATRLLSEAVATHIRVLAAKKNMNQSDVAMAAGIPTSTFTRYWHGTRSMRLDELERVLTALGTSYGQESGEIRKLMAGE